MASGGAISGNGMGNVQIDASAPAPEIARAITESLVDTPDFEPVLHGEWCYDLSLHGLSWNCEQMVCGLSVPAYVVCPCLPMWCVRCPCLPMWCVRSIDRPSTPRHALAITESLVDDLSKACPCPPPLHAFKCILCLCIDVAALAMVTAAQVERGAAIQGLCATQVPTRYLSQFLLTIFFFFLTQTPFIPTRNAVLYTTHGG